MDSRELRARAAQACVDTYSGKRLKIGTTDCVRMARKSLHVQGVSTSILKGRSYRSRKAALAVLDDLGCASLVDALDCVGALERIPPACAWPGDIIAMPAEDGDPFGCALHVRLSDQKTIGFADGRCGIFRADLSKALAAWRVHHG